MKDLLARFYLGLSSSEENEVLLSMLENQETPEFDEFSREKWENANGRIPKVRYFRMHREVMEKIGEQRRARSVFRKILASASVAAAIVISALIGFSIGGKTHPKDEKFEVIALSGQKSGLILPDGSKVWLNSGSSISYLSSFNDDERSIMLDGEAYFEVAKNEKIPFVVTAGAVSVKALGTQFNVRAYSTEDEIVTTLVEGKVVAYTSEDSEVILPNQQVVFDRKTGHLSKSDAPCPGSLVPWRENKLYLDDMSLEELCVMLERMYNVDVTFADETIKEFRYTGLVRNSSLSNVLELISSTSPVSYVLTDNTVKLTKNQK